MSTADHSPGDPVPPPPPDPAALALSHVRSLVRQGHIEHAPETALSFALVRGKAALLPYATAGQPATPGEAARRFLLAAQAVGEQLERLAPAVAEQAGPSGPDDPTKGVSCD